MRRKEVLFAVIGGIVGAVLVMAAGSVLPLGAQNEVTDVEFGVVTCREIKVVNSDGEARVSMGVAEAGGVVGVIGNGGMPSMGVNELGGIVLMLNKNFIGSLMCADEDGGRVELSSKGSETMVLTGKQGIFDKITCTELDVVGLDGTQMANIFSHGNGGHVYVRGKDGKALAGMGISEDGAAILVRDKEGGTKTLTTGGLR